MSIQPTVFDATDPQEYEEFKTQFSNAASAIEPPTPGATLEPFLEDDGSTDSDDADESEKPAASAAQPSITQIPVYPHLADLPLEVPNLDEAIQTVLADGLYRESEVREAVVALVLGHLMLAGPPGTGKTSLARSLARAFKVDLREATANPEWSVYDVIGSQTLRGKDIVERPGAVTKAVFDCYATMYKHEDTKETDQQATWLLIDEINRAEIDRAFGSLFTALSGGKNRQFSLEYLTPTQTVIVPARFRIIGALNSFDTSFVNSMSAALRRRFARVVVLPPDNDNQGSMPGAEFEAALTKARAIVPPSTSGVSTEEAVARLEAHEAAFRAVFGFFRDSSGNTALMVGTAQAIDALAYILTRIVLSDLTLAVPDLPQSLDLSSGEEPPLLVTLSRLGEIAHFEVVSNEVTAHSQYSLDIPCADHLQTFRQSFGI